MRIIKNLAQHKLVVLLIVVLLCVQAAGDLALPNYTSDIVDTGIQQQGVQDVAAEQLLSGALQAGDTALVDGAENGLRLYAQPAGTQALNTKENEL